MISETNVTFFFVDGVCAKMIDATNLIIYYSTSEIFYKIIHFTFIVYIYFAFSIFILIVSFFE